MSEAEVSKRCNTLEYLIKSCVPEVRSALAYTTGLSAYDDGDKIDDDESTSTSTIPAKTFDVIVALDKLIQLMESTKERLVKDTTTAIELLRVSTLRQWKQARHSPPVL